MMRRRASHLVLLLAALTGIAVGALAVSGRHVDLLKAIEYRQPISGPHGGGLAYRQTDPIWAQVTAWEGVYGRHQQVDLLGFHYLHEPMIVWPTEIGCLEKTGEEYQFAVPARSIAAVVGTLVMTVASRVRRPRKAAGLCQRCGYDLRATPSRCPKCGDTTAAIA